MARFFGTYDDWKLMCPEDERDDDEYSEPEEEDDYGPLSELDEDDWLVKWFDDLDSLNLNLSLDIYMQLPTNMQLQPR